MRLMQRCQQLLRGACLAAEQGSACSPSGILSWERTVQQLSRRSGVADGVLDPALGMVQWQQLRWASQGTRSFLAVTPSSSQELNTCSTSCALPWAVSQARGLFGARKPVPPNPQIHTHDKYKKTYDQPKYEWMLGRFVMDRNRTIWHRQANYRHHRHSKTASQLTRLKRWKPLHSSLASKLIKLGFRNRYWAPPDPQEVPGGHEGPDGRRTVFQRQQRRCADADLNQTVGDPSLRQSWKPPPRQGLR